MSDKSKDEELQKTAAYLMIWLAIAMGVCFAASLGILGVGITAAVIFIGISIGYAGDDK